MEMGTLMKVAPDSFASACYSVGACHDSGMTRDGRTLANIVFPQPGGP